MMDCLPLPICNIIYRYLYDRVLTQLTESHGNTINLRSRVYYCHRIADDTAYSERVRHWRVRYIDEIRIVYAVYYAPCWWYKDNMHYSIPQID